MAHGACCNLFHCPLGQHISAQRLLTVKSVGGVVLDGVMCSTLPVPRCEQAPSQGTNSTLVLLLRHCRPCCVVCVVGMPARSVSARVPPSECLRSTLQVPEVHPASA